MSKLTTFHSHLANPKQLSLPPLLMLTLLHIQMQCATPPPEKKKKRVVIYKSKQKETPQPGRSTAGPPVSLKPAASESPFGVGWPRKVVRSHINVPARTDAGDAQAPIRWA